MKQKQRTHTVIKIDLEVRGLIRQSAMPYEPVNAVLRRLLGMNSKPKKETRNAGKQN